MKKTLMLLVAALPALAASIPSGADISVRTQATIHAEDADENHIFPANVQHDVLDRDGRVIASNTPDAIRKETGEDDLEDAFIALAEER